MKSLLPPFIKLVNQRHSADCSVACLAMLTGTTYEESLLAIGTPKVFEKGVQLQEVRDAALALGHRVKLHRRVRLEDDWGILAVRSDRWRNDHLVMLFNGSIYDASDQGWWEADDYLKFNRGRILSLLTLPRD